MADKYPPNAHKETKLSESEKKFFDNFEEFTGYKRSIFMIGITGAGKSTFCNFLVNEKLFDEGCGFISKTQVVGACKFNFNSEDVLIIDCPGFCDSKRPAEDIHDEICKVGVMAKDGTDAVAIVVSSMERFSDNHRNVLNQLEYLGGSLWEHAFLVFTRESKIIKEFGVTSGEEYIELISSSSECPPVLAEWLKKTQRRFICVDSKKKFQDELYRNEKCSKIFSLIDDIRIKTKNERYNNSLMKQGAKFFRQLAKARQSEEGLQKLTVQMERQRQEDKKKIEKAQRKLEETQKAAMEQSEEGRRRYEEAQNEIKEMHRRSEQVRRSYEAKQDQLREEYKRTEYEKDREIAQLKANARSFVSESSSCFSWKTKIMLSRGELVNICNINSAHVVATPNGPRKVALLSKIKRYQDTLYSINNLDFKFNRYHPFVAWNAANMERTSLAVIDVNDFINFMPTMAARNVKSLYDSDTKLVGFSNGGLSPISIESISKSCEELSPEYNTLYDVILEPNGTGINEYYAGDGNQMFLVLSEISTYTLEAERQYVPAYIAILSIINKTSQRETVYSSSSLNTENDVINFFENEIVQNGISLLLNAVMRMSNFNSLKLTKASKTINEMEKRLKQTLSFFSGSKPIAVTTLSLIYQYLQTLICPLHTMIKLGWRTYVAPEERDTLAIGIADVSFVSDECFSKPIEILLMTNTEQEPYKMEEKENFANNRMRQISESIYIPYIGEQDDKLYLIVKEKNTSRIIARKCIRLESDLVYDYRLLRLFPYDNVNISEVRVNMDLRVVSNEQMKQEIEAKQEWNEEFEIHFAEILASKIVDSLVEKIKS